MRQFVGYGRICLRSKIPAKKKGARAPFIKLVHCLTSTSFLEDPIDRSPLHGQTVLQCFPSLMPLTDRPLIGSWILHARSRSLNPCPLTVQGRVYLVSLRDHACHFPTIGYQQSRPSHNSENPIRGFERYPRAIGVVSLKLRIRDPVRHIVISGLLWTLRSAAA